MNITISVAHNNCTSKLLSSVDKYHHICVVTFSCVFICSWINSSPVEEESASFCGQQVAPPILPQTNMTARGGPSQCPWTNWMATKQSRWFFLKLCVTLHGDDTIHYSLGRAHALPPRTLFALNHHGRHNLQAHGGRHTVQPSSPSRSMCGVNFSTTWLCLRPLHPRQPLTSDDIS